MLRRVCVHGGLDTIVTLATPNAGAIDTAQLAVVGQAIMAAGRLVTAFSPRQGLLDLTRADRLMAELRDRQGVASRIAGKRYASVPALYFHEHREAWRTGSRLMGAPSGAIGIANLVPLISRVHRPHDGIVTEKSCNIADPQSAPFSEIDHADGDRLNDLLALISMELMRRATKAGLEDEGARALRQVLLLWMRKLHSTPYNPKRLEFFVSEFSDPDRARVERGLELLSQCLPMVQKDGWAREIVVDLSPWLRTPMTS